MAKPLVIYHANCTDGFTAAWVAAKALGDVELFPGFYGSAPPEVKDRQVYVLDFSYKRAVMEQFIASLGIGSLVVLDHHVTAEADLAGLRGDRVTIVFDMARSGARLAWDYFADHSVIGPSSAAEWLINYVQDRDLWQWELPDSRLVSAGIEAVAKTLPAWDALAKRTPVDLAKDGAVIEAYRKLCIEAAVGLARWMPIVEHRVLAANTSEMRFASDTAYELADGQPFGATYWIRADGVVQFSLRSRDDGVDVSEIARGYGGGGHAHAAGFQATFEQFAGMFRKSETVG